MAELTVWGIGTPRTMRAHWTMLCFALDYDFHPVTSRSGETMTPDFRALNPKHKIPVLRHGGRVLTESAAIATYIAETFPPPDGFFVPADAARRARLNELCYFIMSELDGHAIYTIRRHADLADLYGAAPNAVAAAKAYFAEHVANVFAELGAHGDFVMEEGMSVADILLATCIDAALVRHIPLPDTLHSYMDRICAMPSYRAAFARNFPHRAGEMEAWSA